jgi:PAS domain-containing protein
MMARSSRLIGTIMDETDRVDSERERHEAETRFEIGFEQSAIGSVITDLAGIPIRVNPALCRLLGRRRASYSAGGRTSTPGRRSAAR